MRKEPTFDGNKETYLKKLRKAGEKSEVAYLGATADNKRQIYTIFGGSSRRGLYIERHDEGSPPKTFFLSFFEIKKIVAYTEGMKRKNNKKKHIKHTV
ncbi:MAG: hypothetical protein Q8P07_03670 [bacterium]|nr:hypothetical protein [bacterium]